VVTIPLLAPAPRGARAHINFLQVVLVALRQARPRGADGMGRPARPLRRSMRRYSLQRDEFHRMEMRRPAINEMRCARRRRRMRRVRVPPVLNMHDYMKT